MFQTYNTAKQGTASQEPTTPWHPGMLHCRTFSMPREPCESHYKATGEWEHAGEVVRR